MSPGKKYRLLLCFEFDIASVGGHEMLTLLFRLVCSLIFDSVRSESHTHTHNCETKKTVLQQ